MGGRSAALILHRSLAGRLLAVAVSAALAATNPATACAAAAAQAGVGLDQLDEIAIIGERPGPRLWKVSKGDHVLWLLGTLSHIPKRMTWRSSEVESALAGSQQLLASGPSVSADVGPFAAIRLYLQWRRTQKSPDRLRLDVWLPAPLYARFEALKARFDAGDDGIEELRPSFAALRLYEHAVDAAGMTQHDEVEQAVIKLAKRRGIPIQRPTLRVEDPSGTLKEVSALPPTAEVECLAATVARIETDWPSMQQRARAWAIGDVDRLRALPYPNQREVCINALANSPRIKALVDTVVRAWSGEAEAALERNRVSFAMRPIYELLDPEGPLARFRAEGYRVDGP
ncbi:MAG: TraB/GumN family protein [Steroidobacterales bacterium]